MNSENVPTTGTDRITLEEAIAPHWLEVAKKLKLNELDIVEITYSPYHPTLINKADYLLTLAKLHFGKKREHFKLKGLKNAMKEAGIELN